MKTTKEELIAENSVLKAEIERLKEADDNIRYYLSTTLESGYCKKKNSYDEEKRYVYNWHEIFREIGKLLEKKRYVNLEDEIQGNAKDAAEREKHIIGMLKHHFPEKFQDFHVNDEYLRL